MQLKIRSRMQSSFHFPLGSEPKECFDALDESFLLKQRF